MDNCFVACGWDSYEGITKSDFDRFTDKIENVLNDERGRKLFRNFMHTSDLDDGLQVLDVWEHIERLLKFEENAESGSLSHKDVKRLLKLAEKGIEEIDVTTTQRIDIALKSNNKEGIVEGLHLLKVDATKALKREYSAFRNYFIPSK